MICSPLFARDGGRLNPLRRKVDAVTFLWPARHTF